MSALSQAEIERRLPVWLAMADLFLDTAYLEIMGAESVAAPLRQSGYDRETLNRIFYDEVLPAFAFNALDIAGEWAAWHPEFVRERMVEAMAGGRPPLTMRIQARLVRRFVEPDWRKVEALI